MKRSALILAVVAGIACIALAADPGSPKGLSRRRTPIVDAVDKARMCVVNLSTERVVYVRSRDPSMGSRGDVFDRMFQEFFQRQRYKRKKVETPLGSGVIVDEAGFVVTNEHVVRRASNLRLSLPDGSVHDAILLSADPANDVALLRVQGRGKFVAAKIGTSADLMLGETVIALGNPFGFANSVTSGIVSARHREITIGQGRSAVQYDDLIQISALINPGNSGGPLLNLNAELIGINTAIVEEAQGIGFAIPIDKVKRVLARLFASPQATTAWLGVEVGPPKQGEDGAVVTEVEPGSPAERAGLKVGDVIAEMDGVRVRDDFEFCRALVTDKPGDRVQLALRRKNATVRPFVVLEKRPAPTPGKVLRERVGLSAQTYTNKLARQLRLPRVPGVLIVAVDRGGPAHEAGLRSGDIIVQFGEYRVRGVDEIALLLRKVLSGQQVYVQIVRGDYRAEATVTVR